MPDSKSHQLEALIAALDGHLAMVRKHGLAHAALFLSAAKLDLQMQLHGISNEELWALCNALDRQPEPVSSAGVQRAVCADIGNVISISEERRQRNAAGRALRKLARGPIRTA